MLVDVLLVFDQLIRKLLLQIDTLVAGLRQAVDNGHHQMKTIQIVQHRHIERCRNCVLRAAMKLYIAGQGPST